MNDLLIRLARAQGLNPGPESEVALEFARLPDGGLGLLAIVAVLAITVSVVRFGRRDAAQLGRPRGALLTGLRLATLLVLAVVLTDPQIVTRDRATLQGRTLVLVDASQSMAGTDAYRSPRGQSISESLRSLGIADPSKDSRIEIARAMLGPSTLSELTANNRVDIFGFGDSPTLVASLPRTSSAGPTALTNLTADRPVTDPVAAIEKALARASDSEVAGLVLLSDGRRNQGARLESVRRILEARGVGRTILVPVGDPSPTQSLAIVRLECPDEVFPADPFELTVEVASRGLDGEMAVLQLSKRIDGSDESTRVASRDIRISGATLRVPFTDLRMDDAGEQVWEVRLVPPSNFDLEPEDAVRTHRVLARESRTRVLLLAGGPSFEYRALRRAWTREDTVEVACWLQSASVGFPQDGDVSLEALPSGEALAEFDVFVLVDPDPRGLPRGFAEELAGLVRDHGNGLWFVCGEVFTRKAFLDDAGLADLAPLLPIRLDHVRADSTIGLSDGSETVGRYRPTPSGSLRGPARLLDSKDENELLWRQLPGPRFIYPSSGPTPGSEVLLEVSADTGEAAVGPEPRAVLASRKVGAGRVLASTSDETWLWRGVAPQAHERFWLQGLRILSESRLGASTGGPRLVLERDEITLGQTLRMTVLDAAGSSAEVVVEHEGDTGAPQRLPTDEVPESPDRLSAEVRPTRLGAFRARLELAGRDPGAWTDFRVTPAELESTGPSMVEEFRALAEADDIVVVQDASRLGETFSSIQPSERQETVRAARSAWDGPWTLILLGLLLVVEWTLRKSWDLL